MQTLRSYTFNEKFAAGLLVLFFPIYVTGAAVLGPDSVLTSDDLGRLLLWQIAWWIIAFVAFCAATAIIFFKPDHHPSRLRMHIGRILPLSALVVAMLLSSVAIDALSDRRKQAFARLHSVELAGPPPRAVVYREGIPDGGIAIVRSPGRNPEGFAQAIMIDLTGERIKSCEPVSDRDWSCHFD
jgi:hypothetical protein